MPGESPVPDNAALPQLNGRPMVTDGGLETDLIFNHGVDLPDFAAFPLLDDEDGRRLLSGYYDDYASIAARAGAGLLLESPTWRANPDWGARLGRSGADLTRVNIASITLLQSLRDRYAADVADIVVSGVVGPRGDGYRSDGAADPDEAERYHRSQVAAFAAAGADVVTALTLTDPGEAIGIVRASREEGLPVAISFTVEVDGRLPDGTPLSEAVTVVDAAARPDYYLVNCAHPRHVLAAVAAGTEISWGSRILGMRYNASTRSHAELDEADDLDAGDLDVLAGGHAQVLDRFGALTVIGGCCGTDASHVAALWGV
ncbi:MAG TPA: homocysteine S-methyltransferase family protein [Humibacillus sp.]|nr:homocysteine S-methyltransferase family protein [Humibacillus sp.]